MNVLIVGSGGREHALVKMLKKSEHVSKIFCVPGNAGIAQDAICESISVENIRELIAFARKNKIDFTIVGPEIPLVMGIVDEFENNGMPIFGPGKQAAELEGSKAFAKHIMREYDIPTADFQVFTDYDKARRFVYSQGGPLVVKADGLAAGKGALVCDTTDQALEAVKMILRDAVFGQAGRKVLIEEKLEGQEVSMLGISDGENLVYLSPSQDHKRVFDKDRGPNTGGMGAYAPAPQLDEGLMDEVRYSIMERTIKGMALEGRPFKGVLYAGLMLTLSGPKVLEYNCRFGDPETQAVLPLVESDLLEVMMAARDGQLDEYEFKNSAQSAVCVVIASGGYPGEYEKEKPILGLNQTFGNDVMVFHAGTKQQGNDIVTAGGRVLGVTAVADELKQAINRVYEAVGKITFDGAYYRKDIAAKALKILNG